MLSPRIQDGVLFYENLIYSKTYRSIFVNIFQKMGIPHGGKWKGLSAKIVKNDHFSPFLLFFWFKTLKIELYRATLFVNIDI